MGTEPVEGVASHTFGDPEEALAHFAPERQAAARPREIRLDEDGHRLPTGERDDATTEEDGTTPDSATGDPTP